MKEFQTKVAESFSYFACFAIAGLLECDENGRFIHTYGGSYTLDKKMPAWVKDNNKLLDALREISKRMESK